jgi:hypothetical protein
MDLKGNVMLESASKTLSISHFAITISFLNDGKCAKQNGKREMK